MKPLLAATVKSFNQIRFPVLASPKLDGVRALVIDGVVVSRTLKPIPNLHVQKMFGKPEYNGFDGELIVGDSMDNDTFTKTTSGVMTIEGEPDVWFHVFDDFYYLGVFQTRLDSVAKRIVAAPKGSRLAIVHHSMLMSLDVLEIFEDASLKVGYEGVMLRDPMGHYKYGRSTEKEAILMKVKRFTDGEATVVGFTEAMHNSNEAQVNELGTKERSHRKDGMVGKDVLGSLKVVNDAGVDFEIGTGFTNAQRIALWNIKNSLVGKIVKYKSQEVGVKDRPRFPVFLGFRDPIDM